MIYTRAMSFSEGLYEVEDLGMERRCYRVTRGDFRWYVSYSEVEVTPFPQGTGHEKRAKLIAHEAYEALQPETANVEPT